jgi:methionyl-tRNA formyltransferase
VVTQPDRPAGRGHKLVAPAVKDAAIDLGLPVHQPESLRTPELRKPLVEAEADIFVVAAFGLIFGEKTLAIPRYGAVNLHASLLPAYRGANPIAASIASGEVHTGVSLMVMERGLDSGPVIAMRSIEITGTDTTASLTERLAHLGAGLLIEEVENYIEGASTPIAQPNHGVTLARPMRKADGEIDWSQSAVSIDRHIRAMWPWPRAWSALGETIVQIHSATVCDGSGVGAAGTILINGAVRVSTGDGFIELGTVQFPGKSAVNAALAANGGWFIDHARFEPANPGREPLVTQLNGDSSTTV